MKIITFEMAKKRIEERFPNQPFELLEYTKVTKPCKVKCLQCGEIITASTFKNFINSGSHARKFLCQCYNKDNKKNKHNINQEKVLKICEENKNLQFVSFDYNSNTKKYIVNCLCLHCNQVFQKSWQSFLENQTCPYCENKQLMNSQSFQLMLPEEYTLIGEYVNSETPVLIKHKCGFIWKIKPHHLIYKINNDNYSGCPKCNHKNSRGETTIKNWLKDHNIQFVQEQIFPWQSNSKFRYDFYLPEEKLVIEYMGQQHYYEVNFFHDTLAERQEHDRIKKEKALSNGLQYLAISYLDFKNINTILNDWFNDYPGKE